MVKIKQNDFVEIEFTGKIAETGEIFDTNIKEEAKKAGLDIKNIKPFLLSIGHKMLPPGLDKDLGGKEIGKNYSIEINPENAFGKRNPEMIRMIPTKLFHKQNINPERGTQLTLDGQLVRVLSNSSGRTLVDFNNPLAGKKIKYDYKIIRKIKEQKEKVDAIQEFLFRRKFEFDIKDKKIIFKVKKEEEVFIKMFQPKFKEILGMEIEGKITEEENKGKNSK
jgi:FKBP-type peptidyl-prolyl cis-trans isomerase SlyD|tara:strand:+ start:542 stop:1207 length:666 start_codon:yes stop_codon:yes gene_type:complete